METILSVLIGILIGLGMPFALFILMAHEKLTDFYYEHRGIKRTYTPGTPGVFILVSVLCSVAVLAGLSILTYFHPSAGGTAIVLCSAAAAFIASKLGFM